MLYVVRVSCCFPMNFKSCAVISKFVKIFLKCAGLKVGEIAENVTNESHVLISSTVEKLDHELLIFNLNCRAFQSPTNRLLKVEGKL